MRVVLMQGLVLLLVLVPLAGFGAYVWHKHLWAQDMLSKLEPRYARLRGVQAKQAEFEQAVKQAQYTLARYVYPASVDASNAGNDAQQHIRAVFEESLLTVGSIQVLEAKTGDNFERIGIVMQAEGEMPALQAALLQLRVQSPAILVDSFAIQAVGPIRPESAQRLNASFSFTVLRSLP